MDLADATGQPVTVTIAGREWRVKPRGLDEMGELQGWFKREIPSPGVRAMLSVDQARRLKLGIGQAVLDAMLEAGQRGDLSWPPRVGSYHWLDAVDQAGKAAHVLAFALRPEHPEIDDDAAGKLSERAGDGEVATAVYAALFGGLPDPKAPAPTTGPTTTMTAPTPPSGTTGATSSTTSPPPGVGPTP